MQQQINQPADKVNNKYTDIRQINRTTRMRFSLAKNLVRFCYAICDSSPSHS